MTPEAKRLVREALQPPPASAPFGVAVPGTAEPDRTPIYRHWRFKDGGLLDTLDPNAGINTGHDLFEAAVAQQPRAKCFGFRPWDPVKKAFGEYHWLDYGTVAARRANLGAGLVEVHRKVGITGTQYGVGLWCQNRPEWHLIDLACMSQSLFSVSLYDTLGPTATEYIANHATLACIATSLPHLPTLLNLKPRLPHLKIIVLVDSADAGEQPGYSKYDILSKVALDHGIDLYTITQLEELGQSLGPPKFRAPSSEDIITVNYTSGTTGNPKGVMLSHRAAIAACASSMCTVELRSSDVGFSYLPLAHIYARMIEQSGLWFGGSVAFFHGNVLELVDDLKLVRPHAFISVPRLWNRFGGAIKASTVEQGGARGALSRHVVATKLAALKDPDSPSATNKHMLYDRIWGKKVAAALGLDRARTAISGAAPLDPSLHQFLRSVFGNRFVQGWGMTETYAVGLGQTNGDLSTGNCGAPAPCSEFCLLSVPDMEYLVTDKPHPRGELLIRGKNMFSGYYKNEEETAKSMLPGGWFKTGDIATIDNRGRFKIIDRRKNVLKLAQGEYISPERIENVYLANLTYLNQGYVHGDSLKTSLVAIFGVMPDTFAPYASKVLGKQIVATDLDAIKTACNDERLRAVVQKDLDRVGTKNKFAGYEKVKACALYVEPFSIDNDLLTPTLKLKRPQAAKMYRERLSQLYEEVSETERKAKL